MTENSIGPGTVLAGRFRLEDLLLEASGARYWRATDQILARSVSVHVVPTEDPRAPLLLTAARASATVADGHFLRVLDAAREEDVAYVVNEWGSGHSLDTILADGPLPPRRAAWVVKEVADAIGTAHRAGVAHGRLRPGCVMITEAGAVKVSGFVVDAALARDGAPQSAGRSPGAAPEEQQADVEALAALLYATLVGRWPGEAGSALPEAPREHGRPLRPRQVRAGVPRPLDAVCERVLNGDRHPEPITSAQQVSSALAAFIGNPAGATALEATTVISPGQSEGAASETGTGSLESPGPAKPASGGPPWAGTPDLPADPEATRAGAPVFFDDDTKVGWASADDPSDHASRTASRSGPHPSPAPPPPSPSSDPDATSVQGPAAPHPGPAPTWGAEAARGYGASPLEDRDRRRAGKGWLVLAAVVAAAVGLGLVALFVVNLDEGPDGQRPAAQPTRSQQPSPTSPTPSGPVAIAGVSDFDPQGEPPEENSEDAGLAIDGRLATSWQTVTYYDPLEDQKDGVGLLVDLGRPVRVSEATLTLTGSNTDLQLFAASEGASAPTSTEAMEAMEMVASAKNAGTTVELPFQDPVTTQYLVVWLTSLPTVEGGFQGSIVEIAVQS